MLCNPSSLFTKSVCIFLKRAQKSCTERTNFIYRPTIGKPPQPPLKLRIYG